ncbi:uncharacterized protein OCT59_001897 [Rhizophagus irregularis]|uniref:Uncharacterized protein n=1 Tax=Rhizophagus irregularis (strain DAOM 197198w) TaxID=1432141 RepID=A0A015J5E8_RHIIW|nr:hypothetical protein RirG_166060 [Rhizophagus irregularis DAOM 197198w]UZO10306.1 hypothetical protein OCT59_001897 [Rhizophagus irregularis]GBC47576.2 hypothetical protein RIR_v02004127000 [Rhizophagus irregularis DAOM 181602=DAOM 197198]
MLFVSQVFELIESLDDDEAKAKIKEQFNFLKQTVDTKLKLFEESIENTYAIDILFPTDQNDGKKKLKTVDVCKELISAGIDSLFRNNVIGESEQAFDYILLQNNALVRIDIRIWYYKFSSSGVLSNVESAFCYVFSKSILDRNKLSNDELTYYFSEFAENCGDSVDDTIKRISDIYNSASSCKTDDKKILNSKLIDDKTISNGDDVQEEKEESKINS